jgi:SPP1 gp7 family putative phage head morphogenesis protein
VTKAQTSPADVAAGVQLTSTLKADAATVAELVELLTDAYGDAYMAGAHAAQMQGAAVLTADLAQALATVNWSAWKPGYAAAADKVKGAGLADLLGQADITIKGITETNLERMGNALSQGLANGDDVGTIARTIGDLTTSAGNAQAQLIAVTEVARAQIAGTVDQFTEAGIDQFDLLTESDACAECLDVADDNPHDLSDSDAYPPIHPRCRCAITAVVKTGGGDAPTEEDADDDE